MELTSGYMRRLSTSQSSKSTTMGPEKVTLSGRGLSRRRNWMSKLGHVDIPDELTVMELLNSEGMMWGGIHCAGRFEDVAAGLIMLSALLAKRVHRGRVDHRSARMTEMDILAEPVIMDVMNPEGVTLCGECCVGYFGDVIIGMRKADGHANIVMGASSFGDEYMDMRKVPNYAGDTRDKGGLRSGDVGRKQDVEMGRALVAVRTKRIPRSPALTSAALARPRA